MADSAQSERKISELAAEHAAYLAQGGDPALPDECELCAELKAAGRLEFVARGTRRKPRWEVK